MPSSPRTCRPGINSRWLHRSGDNNVDARRLAVLLAAGADALASRAVKAREFRRLDPEMFAAQASAAVMAGCLAMVCVVAPISLHPLVMPCAPLVIGLLATRALGCFHQRG